MKLDLLSGRPSRKVSYSFTGCSSDDDFHHDNKGCCRIKCRNSKVTILNSIYRCVLQDVYTNEQLANKASYIDFDNKIIYIRVDSPDIVARFDSIESYTSYLNANLRREIISAMMYETNISYKSLDEADLRHIIEITILGVMFILDDTKIYYEPK